MTWIKICGNTNLEDALAAVEAGADAVGFIFAPSSRRIDPKTAEAMVAQLPETLEKVGVFVNESAEHIREIVEQVHLTAVQLHGDESPDFARNLFRRPGRARRSRLRVFKALPVHTGIERALREFAHTRGIAAVLLDSAAHDSESPRGGTGWAFDWGRAATFVPGVAERVRVILAGGLTPANVTQAIQVLSPWGVDVCSGVERSPGKKDPARMRAFVAAVRATRAKKT